MSISKTFVNLYDIAGRARIITDDSFDVREHEAGATVNSLHIEHVGAKYDSYSFNVVKGMKDITESRSNYLSDSDCDGVSFEIINNHDGLIFAELKSRFSSRHLKKALMQMMFSFLKMHSMLSLCDEYEIDSVSVRFVAACQCFEDDNQKDGVYNMILKMESLGGDSFEGSFLRKLIERRDITVKFSEIANLWHLPLHKKLMSKEVTLSLQMTANYGDTSLAYIY